MVGFTDLGFFVAVRRDDIDPDAVRVEYLSEPLLHIDMGSFVIPVTTSFRCVTNASYEASIAIESVNWKVLERIIRGEYLPSVKHLVKPSHKRRYGR